MTDRPIRLYVDAALGPDAPVTLTPPQAHYLGHVMRVKAGDALAVFNGRDGEWSARVAELSKKGAVLTLGAQRRAQTAEPDVWLAFAPLKKTRTDLVVEKATELGASAFWPVFTRHTNAERINLERMRAIAVEAAEQCERLSVPAVHEPCALDALLTQWPPQRRLFVLDETGAGRPLAEVLPAFTSQPCGFLVGPEGGFAQSELDVLAQVPFVTRLGLGPRILRAETAALAALVGWQSLIGDWR